MGTSKTRKTVFTRNCFFRATFREMFKPKKPTRPKKVGDTEDVDMDIEDDDRPQVTKKEKKKKKKVKKSGLSFADDDPSEETENFKLKKSSRSKKIAAKIRAEVEEERK